MHRLLTVFLCCVLITANTAQILAVGKITVEPNTISSAAQSQETSFWTADNRLAQNVTLEAHRKTVLSIISDISSQTGVKINVGFNSKDWQVRDRKMVIFAKDMPLLELMQSISRVMKFKWQRTKADGTYSYRLYMDRKAVIEAEAESARAEERYYKEQQEKREKLADRFKGLSKLSKSDLAKLREDDPMSYSLAASGLAGALEQLFSEAPEALDAFISGSEMFIPRGNSSASLQSAITSVAQAVMRFKMDSSMPSAEEIAYNPQMISEIRLYLNNPNEESNLFTQFTEGQVGVMYARSPGGDTEFGFPIMDPESSVGKGIGKALAQVMETGSTDAMNNISIKIDPKEMQQNNFGEPIVEHKEKLVVKDEIDVSKIKLNAIPTDRYADYLAKFAEVTKLNVVSDSFPKSNSFNMNGNYQAGAFLKSLELLNDYNWWKHGSIIELRDRHWFRKRSLEIPEVWLECWRSAFQETGTLDIDDLADMAMLVGDTDKYEANIIGDPALDCDSMKWAIRQSTQFLRFYSILSATQRKAIYTHEGLDLSDLSPALSESAASCICWWDGKSPAVIKGTRSSSGKQFVYSFTEGDRIVSYITTPEYKPRKAEN